jgi:hypothetical protein
MADYQLTATDFVIRSEDSAYIPNDPTNMDRVRYEEWLAGGGVPDPYVEPEPTPPAPSRAQELAFDHENRLLALEGQPPLTMADFITKNGF